MKGFLVGLLLVSTASAQFGLDKLKDKINSTTQKTKPVSDRAEKAADTFTPWTAEEEQEVGEASAEKMVAIFGLVDSPAIENYVNLVGSSVARYASRELPYKFGVLNTEIVGAYGLPGGYIFVTRGALESMNNEAELAGVLGHEIEHVAARHLEDEIRAAKTSAWAREEAVSKTKTGQQLARLRADALLKDLFNTSLSRSKEDDADQQGARMAAECGYAGNGLLEFIKVLAVENADPSNGRLFGQLLSTHPSFDQRIEHLSSLPTNRSKGKTLEARFGRALGR